MPVKRVAVVTALLTAVAGVAADRPEGRLFASRSPVVARHGMVAAEHPLAAQVGLDVLKKGGSAVDAAIAVNAALGLMEPVSSGLGGDLFAMVWDPATGTLYGLNGSGRAPRLLTPDKVKAADDGTIPPYTPFAWTVPGCADAWFELHARFGRLPMREILAPTIAYAREGVPVPQVIAGAWARGARIFKDKPGFADVFLSGGRAPAEGEPFANPALAKTLELLATGGRDAFYRGEIADQIVAFSQQVGGFFTKEDFLQHHSDWVTPVSTTYHGVTVWELPPNTQGIAALELLNIIERFDLKVLGRDSIDFWHTFIEAKKLAFEDRAKYYADPAFANLPFKGLIEKAYAQEQAKRIDPTRAAKTLEAGNPALRDGDTTFLVTADDRGMMVALIQSNYTGFGSGYAIPTLGFGIQDRGALFALQKGHANVLAPGKRPFHTIIPAFMGHDGKPDTAFGVMGGDMQPQGHAQIVVNLVDFGMNLQEAGDAARFYHTGSSEPTGTVMKEGGNVHLEYGVPPEVRLGLIRRGHRLVETTGTAFGGYEAIHRDPKTGVYTGATESRKDGCAIGY